MTAHTLIPEPIDVIRAFSALRRVDIRLLIDRDPGSAALTRERHELRWALRRLTMLSHASIAEGLGCDPTTVHHSETVIADRVTRDRAYAQALEELLRDVRQWIARDPLGKRIDVKLGDIRPMPTALREKIALAILRDQNLSDSEARHAAGVVLGGDQHAHA